MHLRELVAYRAKSSGKKGKNLHTYRREPTSKDFHDKENYDRTYSTFRRTTSQARWTNDRAREGTPDRRGRLLVKEKQKEYICSDTRNGRKADSKMQK